MDFKNISTICGVIISEGKATLNELRTIYDIEDAYILWEVIAVTKYNEFLSMEHASKARQ